MSPAMADAAPVCAAAVPANRYAPANASVFRPHIQVGSAKRRRRDDFFGVFALAFRALSGDLKLVRRKMRSAK